MYDDIATIYDSEADTTIVLVMNIAANDINSEDGQQVCLMPNPAVSEFTIDLSNANLQPPYTIRMLDLNGKAIFEDVTVNRIIEVEINTYYRGVYMVQIVDSNMKMINKSVMLK